MWQVILKTGGQAEFDHMMTILNRTDDIAQKKQVRTLLCVLDLCAGRTQSGGGMRIERRTQFCQVTVAATAFSANSWLRGTVFLLASCEVMWGLCGRQSLTL
jgi:hypothetical protein